MPHCRLFAIGSTLRTRPSLIELTVTATVHWEAFNGCN
jgi:hypothetical protein